MAPLAISLFKRTIQSASAAVSSGEEGVSTVGYVGFAVAGCLALVAVVSFALVWYRRKTRKEKEAAQLASLTVKGVVTESDEKEPLPSAMLGLQQQSGKGFSRANLTRSIIMPEKSIIRPNASRQEIISYYQEQGTLPRPFAPFKFALNATSMKPPPSGTLSSPSPTKSIFSQDSLELPHFDHRMSTASFSASAARLAPPSSRSARRASVFSSIRDSFIGGGGFPAAQRGTRTFSMASGFSTTSNTKGLQMMRVRQLFTPILPDEPTVMLGERVAVMKSFDDGWCIVGRDKPYDTSGEVELGAIPAWCFVKPMKGLKSERPVRSSSLGVTVQMDADGADKPREDYISWSNF